MHTRTITAVPHRQRDGGSIRSYGWPAILELFYPLATAISDSDDHRNALDGIWPCALRCPGRYSWTSTASSLIRD